MKVLANLRVRKPHRNLSAPLRRGEDPIFVPLDEFSIKEYADKEEEFQKLFSR